jgi:2-oxoglutarate dehydrogenase E1 component
MDGVGVRFSGQDIVRGAFSQRHFAVADSETGALHVHLEHLAESQGRFEVINSPLSEYAVLGFEYGYSLERPDRLVLWEAQFGDFANGAQIIIDQFLVSGRDKWNQRSGLVILLPHGLEGQGPEHSSARPERLLQLAARDNIEIAHPSTPANYFHLLRRQVRRSDRKPLLILGPKSLLRLPAAQSPLVEFGPDHGFRPVIAAEGATGGHLILSSGKIAYDAEQVLGSAPQADVSLARLEMLYPFPAEPLRDLFRKIRPATVTWLQEEPRNMGAWSYVDRRLERALAEAGLGGTAVHCVARPEASSPAGSFHGDHESDQKRLVAEALGRSRDE